ncbi:MAG: Spy/CpxP family protein refolding chaperone [Deltaproteobacteria bacterium]|nr:Spy/CpxP family protein refolding chaperone [Deltaproteobacteria bacterium]
MKKSIGTIALAVLTMIGLAGEAMAQGRGQWNGGPGRRFAALDLTAAQQHQIALLRAAAVKQSEPLRVQMGQKLDELRNLWRADQPDRSAIAQKQAELDTLRAKQRAIRTEFRYQVHAVLTPEQRSKWADFSGPGMGRGPGRGFKQGGPRGGGFWGGGFGNPDCPLRAR